MKINLTVKHAPAESPGMWNDSTLKLKLTAPKWLIVTMQAAILGVLNRANEDQN